MYLITRYATPCQNFFIIETAEKSIFFIKNDYFDTKKSLSKIGSLAKQLNYHFEALSIDTVDFLFYSPGFWCHKAAFKKPEGQLQ
jgi:hypothetical protein